MSETAGRTKAGQFVRGHSVKSPGRPRKPRVDYIAILRECVTEDDHRSIIRRALADAKGGSRHAREWIYKHLMPQFPRLTQYEFSLLEQPSDRKDTDDTDVMTDELRAYVDCMTPEEFEIFVTVTQRVKDYKAGLLVRPRWDITSLVPAGSISKDDEWRQ
jgi:hypothetical protein